MQCPLRVCRKNFPRQHLKSSTASSHSSQWSNDILNRRSHALSLTIFQTSSLMACIIFLTILPTMLISTVVASEASLNSYCNESVETIVLDPRSLENISSVVFNECSHKISVVITNEIAVGLRESSPTIAYFAPNVSEGVNNSHASTASYIPLSLIAKSFVLANLTNGVSLVFIDVSLSNVTVTITNCTFEYGTLPPLYGSDVNMDQFIARALWLIRTPSFEEAVVKLNGSASPLVTVTNTAMTLSRCTNLKHVSRNELSIAQGIAIHAISMFNVNVTVVASQLYYTTSESVDGTFLSIVNSNVSLCIFSTLNGTVIESPMAAFVNGSMLSESGISFRDGRLHQDLYGILIMNSILAARSTITVARIDSLPKTNIESFVSFVYLFQSDLNNVTVTVTRSTLGSIDSAFNGDGAYNGVVVKDTTLIDTAFRFSQCNVFLSKGLFAITTTSDGAPSPRRPSLTSPQQTILQNVLIDFSSASSASLESAVLIDSHVIVCSVTVSVRSDTHIVLTSAAKASIGAGFELYNVTAISLIIVLDGFSTLTLMDYSAMTTPFIAVMTSSSTTLIDSRVVVTNHSSIRTSYGLYFQFSTLINTSLAITSYSTIQSSLGQAILIGDVVLRQGTAISISNNSRLEGGPQSCAIEMINPDLRFWAQDAFLATQCKGDNNNNINDESVSCGPLTLVSISGNSTLFGAVLTRALSSSTPTTVYLMDQNTSNPVFTTAKKLILVSCIDSRLSSPNIAAITISDLSVLPLRNTLADAILLWPLVSFMQVMVVVNSTFISSARADATPCICVQYLSALSERRAPTGNSTRALIVISGTSFEQLSGAAVLLFTTMVLFSPSCLLLSIVDTRFSRHENSTFSSAMVNVSKIIMRSAAVRVERCTGVRLNGGIAISGPSYITRQSSISIVDCNIQSDCSTVYLANATLSDMSSVIIQNLTTALSTDLVTEVRSGRAPSLCNSDNESSAVMMVRQVFLTNQSLFELRVVVAQHGPPRDGIHLTNVTLTRRSRVSLVDFCVSDGNGSFAIMAAVGVSASNNSIITLSRITTTTMADSVAVAVRLSCVQCTLMNQSSLVVAGVGGSSPTALGTTTPPPQGAALCGVVFDDLRIDTSSTILFEDSVCSANGTSAFSFVDTLVEVSPHEASSLDSAPPHNATVVFTRCGLYVSSAAALTAPTNTLVEVRKWTSPASALDFLFDNNAVAAYGNAATATALMGVELSGGANSDETDVAVLINISIAQSRFLSVSSVVSSLMPSLLGSPTVPSAQFLVGLVLGCENQWNGHKFDDLVPVVSQSTMDQARIHVDIKHSCDSQRPSESSTPSLLLIITRTHESASNVGTATLSGSISPAVMVPTVNTQGVVAVSQKVASTMISVGSIVASGTSMGGQAVVAMQWGRSASALSSRRCVVDTAGDDDDESKVGFDFLDNPSGLHLQRFPPSLRYAAGAVLADVALCAGLILLHIAALIVADFHAVATPRGMRELWVCCKNVLLQRLPGAGASSYVLVLQPVTMCSTAMVVSPDRTIGSVLLGTCVLLGFCIAPLAGVSCAFGAAPFPFTVVPEVKHVAVIRAFRCLSKFEECAVTAFMLLIPQWGWRAKDASLTRGAKRMMIRYGPIFAPYGGPSRYPLQWYFLCDWGMVLLSGVVVAFGLSFGEGAVGCTASQAAGWALFSLTLLSSASFLLLRPMAAVMDNFFGCVLGGTAMVSVLLSNLKVHTPPAVMLAELVNYAQTFAAVAVVVLSIAKELPMVFRRCGRQNSVVSALFSLAVASQHWRQNAIDDDEKDLSPDELMVHDEVDSASAGDCIVVPMLLLKGPTTTRSSQVSCPIGNDGTVGLPSKQWEGSRKSLRNVKEKRAMHPGLQLLIAAACAAARQR